MHWCLQTGLLLPLMNLVFCCCCVPVRCMCCTPPAEGRVPELHQLLACGAVRSLKVVDSEGAHVLNLAIQHKQDRVVQVRLGQGDRAGPAGAAVGEQCGSWVIPL